MDFLYTDAEACHFMDPVTYEYEGKIYNFCCPMCIGEFKKDPQKYIDIIEKEKNKAKQ